MSDNIMDMLPDTIEVDNIKYGFFKFDNLYGYKFGLGFRKDKVLYECEDIGDLFIWYYNRLLYPQEETKYDINFNETELRNLKVNFDIAVIRPSIVEVSEELSKYIGETKFVFSEESCGVLNWFILEDNNWVIGWEHLDIK